jgi:hypothetical protein
MKIFANILFFVISLSKTEINAQTNDPILNQIINLDKASFVGKPLDSIIMVLPQGYTGMKIFGIRGTARMLNIRYPDNVWIELHVRSFSFMNPDDPNRIWNTILMRKENLHSVRVYKDQNCYEGCPAY